MDELEDDLNKTKKFITQEKATPIESNIKDNEIPKPRNMCSVCDECDFVSQSMRGLKIHKSAKHMKSILEEFICKECDSKLKTKEQLICHMKVYHNSQV